MVDEDKQACRRLAESGFSGGQWPESYVTHDFLAKYPRAMEPGYLSLNWNHIPGLFRRKDYIRTLVIPPADLERLCDPANLKTYWEPDDDPENFHTTIALAFVKDKFHDCTDKSRQQDMAVSVAVVRKPAQMTAMAFEQAAAELQNDTERTSTLLLVRLHRNSDMFPDVYYKDRGIHFALVYDTGENFNYGSALRFTGAELLSAYNPGKQFSPRAKLPPSWRFNLEGNHPVESCSRDYKDWTTRRKGAKPPETHFAFLSNAFMPFPSDPGQEITLPDSMLGLPPVDRWPPRGGPIPWILNPAEHPRPDDLIMSQKIGKTGTKKRKRPKKKKVKELRVTQKGAGNDEPEYVTCSGSSEASDTTAGDSGVNLASPVPSRTGPKKARLSNEAAGSNASRTPPLSPDARKELDAEAQDMDDPMEDDNPLSGASDHPLSDTDPEGGPVSTAVESSEEDNDGENGDGKDVPADATPLDAEEASQPPAPVEQTPVVPSTSSDTTTRTTPTKNPQTGTAPGAPSGDPDDITEDPAVPDPSSALAYAIQSRVLASPALAVVMAQIGPGFALDATEDKDRQKEYQGVMRGLRGVARIMSDGFEKATADVQAVVNQSLARVIRQEISFIEGASSTLMKWVRAVQPAIDSLDRPVSVQDRLRGEARRDGMLIAREMLSPYDVTGADDPNLDPLHDIIVRAFAAARAPTEKAIIAVHDELAPLAEEHVPPGQERVFLAGAFNVICAYVQEVRSMVLGQAVLPTQVVPGVWGARRGVLAEAPLLAPQIGPVPAVAPAPTTPKEKEVAKPPETAETGIQSDPVASPPAAKPQVPKPLAQEASAQRIQPKLIVAPQRTSSPAKSSKGKSTPGSAERRAHTQMSVQAMWNNPERAREDAAFERSRALRRSDDPEVLIMEDENVDRILSGCPPLQAGAPSSSVTPSARPKATSTISRAPGSGANRSDSPGSGGRTGRDSPTRSRPPNQSVPLPAPVQVPAHRQPENTAPPDPDDVIIVPEDDAPLTGGKGKAKGSAKKNRVYTPGEKAAIEAYRQQLHSDCRQIQYSFEFDDFKAYRRQITNLREAPNTDDHTEYLREKVLKDQPNSYSCAGNLLPVKAFQKRLHRECKDDEKLAKADNMLQRRVLPGVPDGHVGEDGQKVRLLPRYVMQVLQNRNGVVVDSRHADWGRDNNIGLYDIHSPLAMAKKEKSGTTRFEGKTLTGKVSHGYCPMCPYASECSRTLNNHVRLHYRMTMVCGYPDCWEVIHNASSMWAHARTHGFSVAEPCAPRTASKKK